MMARIPPFTIESIVFQKADISKEKSIEWLDKNNYVPIRDVETLTYIKFILLDMVSGSKYIRHKSNQYPYEEYQFIK
jgi:hypothetical protein